MTVTDSEAQPGLAAVPITVTLSDSGSVGHGPGPSPGPVPAECHRRGPALPGRTPRRAVYSG
jgi:hypothetical protein